MSRTGSPALAALRIRRMKIGQRWPENEMRECKVIFSRTLKHGLEKNIIKIEQFVPARTERYVRAGSRIL